MNQRWLWNRYYTKIHFDTFFICTNNHQYIMQVDILPFVICTTNAGFISYWLAYAICKSRIFFSRSTAIRCTKKSEIPKIKKSKKTNGNSLNIQVKINHWFAGLNVMYNKSIWKHLKLEQKRKVWYWELVFGTQVQLKTFDRRHGMKLIILNLNFIIQEICFYYERFIQQEIMFIT